MVRKGKRYSLDEHGLLVEDVGSWAVDKLKIVTDYVQASSAARRRYLRSEAAYIDVFCGPGRSQIRRGALIDGSPVAAFKKAKVSLAPFTSINISDADPELLAAAQKRLSDLGAPVRATPGPANSAIPKIVESLNKNGLHFAFLDPHNLGTLSFDLLENLAMLKRIDIIVHVSVSDLQRNTDRYTSTDHDQFDRFAPGWRAHIKTNVSQKTFRDSLIEYWSDKLESIGLPRAKHAELIRGTRNQ
ncbi:MAG: three-Cys-motif partner protein TcmP, partial [Hyphomicrobiales bacterium]|nr:three-Cys-motif partner protein TcmP [Hyphomicrobiales bacterium]